MKHKLLSDFLSDSDGPAFSMDADQIGAHRIKVPPHRKCRSNWSAIPMTFSSVRISYRYCFTSRTCTRELFSFTSRPTAFPSRWECRGSHDGPLMQDWFKEGHA
jgi:hypothetical protein